MAIEETEQYEIYISLDGFSKRTFTHIFRQLFDMVPNIFVVVLEQINIGGTTEKLFELHRTETIWLNDTFMKTNFTRELVLKSSKNSKRKLVFKVYQRQNERIGLESHILLASCEIPASNVLSDISKRSEFDMTSAQGQSDGIRLILDCERVEHTGIDIARLSFKSCKLPDRASWLSRNDCKKFLVLYRKMKEGGDPEAADDKDKETQKWTRIWKTEVRSGTTKATWGELRIPLRKLCNGDIFREIKIQCYNWKENGAHQLIGATKTNLDELLRLQHKKLPFEGQNAGGLKLRNASVCRDEEFKRHLTNVELQLVVAIDHSMSAERSGLDIITQCKDAVKATCQILEKYDTDKRMQCFGFLPEQADVQHIFPLDQRSEEIKGIHNVIEAYEKSLNRVEHLKPWNCENRKLAPCLEHIVEQVIKTDQEINNRSKYFVVLLISDGNMTDEDFRATMDLIVQSTDLPLSIVLVGVGNGDFVKMETLDGDDCVLSASNGDMSKRDIVQFVRFHNVRGNADALMSEILWEIPSQFVSYLRSFAPIQ